VLGAAGEWGDGTESVEARLPHARGLAPGGSSSFRSRSVGTGCPLGTHLLPLRRFVLGQRE
jgi:hypothetical protein